MRNFLIGFLSVFLIISAASNVKASLLLNGDFEAFGGSDELLSGTGWGVYDQIVGWTKATGPGIELERNTIVDAHSGNYYVELDSHDYSGGQTTNSSMFQTVYLDPGNYELSFWYHARTNNGGEDNGIRGLIGGAFIGEISETLGLMESLWEQVTWEFSIHNKGSYNLTFLAYGEDNSLGGFIDTVTLTQNPEPTTMLLFGFGLLGIARVGRKKL